jgi:hypothetical protein
MLEFIEQTDQYWSAWTDDSLYQIVKAFTSDGLEVYQPIAVNKHKSNWLNPEKSLDEAKAAAQEWEDEHNTKELK